jgi:hypothetical protein
MSVDKKTDQEIVENLDLLLEMEMFEEDVDLLEEVEDLELGEGSVEQSEGGKDE